MSDSTQPNDQFAQWLQNIPAIPAGGTTGLTVTINLSVEQTVLLAAGAARNGCTVAKAIEHLLDSGDDSAIQRPRESSDG